MDNIVGTYIQAFTKTSKGEKNIKKIFCRKIVSPSILWKSAFTQTIKGENIYWKIQETDP